MKYSQSTNLMGLTSSLSDPRTKAYTDLILSVDGKVFSSRVLSANLTLIVVCTQHMDEYMF